MTANEWTAQSLNFFIINETFEQSTAIIVDIDSLVKTYDFLDLAIKVTLF